MAAEGALPLAEMELFSTSAYLVNMSPLLGTLCLVTIVPVTVSCLYYATIFAPICYTRPVLAYLAMAVFLAIPRYCNAATFWPPVEEMILYAVQLPVHMMACRAYQKTDSLWGPILTLAMANLVYCLFLTVINLVVYAQ